MTHIIQPNWEKEFIHFPAPTDTTRYFTGCGIELMRLP